MRIGVLGGGQAGVWLARFLQECGHVEAIEVLEKEAAPGGLCRSYPLAGLHDDVGPHIMFSKHAEVPGLVDAVVEQSLKRSQELAAAGG